MNHTLEKVFSKLGAHPLKILRRAVRPGVEEVTGSWISTLAHLRLTWGAAENDLRSGSLPDPLIRCSLPPPLNPKCMGVENHGRWDVCNPKKEASFPGFRLKEVEKRPDLRKTSWGPPAQVGSQGGEGKPCK